MGNTHYSGPVYSEGGYKVVPIGSAGYYMAEDPADGKFKIGAGGTVQIPGIFAERWHKIASYMTKNRFERLINDAVMSPDKKLLEALLMPMNKPTGKTKAGKAALRRINAWLVAEGNAVLQDIQEEDPSFTIKR